MPPEEDAQKYTLHTIVASHTQLLLVQESDDDAMSTCELRSICVWHPSLRLSASSTRYLLVSFYSVEVCARRVDVLLVEFSAVPMHA